MLNILTSLALLAPLAPGIPADSLTEAAVAQRVEIIRTEYGVPHIFADDLEAMGFALGWVQSEDWGSATAINLVKARGSYAAHVGRDSIAGDFDARERYRRAVETYPLLSAETRAVYEGFAAGVRHYVRLHRDDFPQWMEPDFTALDAHAREVQSWSRGDAGSFVRSLNRQNNGGADLGLGAATDSEAALAAQTAAVAFALDGSNAWAVHGSRTTSGSTILLRNPHLSWSAGYYEAHVVVPGVLDFYGDLRIGGAFGIIGGFNRRLGWATTNNYPRYSQVYALEADPQHQDHYLLDGRSHALQEQQTTVEYRTADGGLATESRVTKWTPHGPVIHEEAGTIFILKDPRDGEWRRGEQFLRMMMSTSLEQWMEVMRMRAHPSSNFTYADADGNIVHLYNARLPLLPHGVTGDTAAVARTTADIWTELVPFDDLPVYTNPAGGYVQQANDTPDYTNLNVPMDRDTMPANLPEPRLRLRSQLSLDLIHDTPPLSLEDVVTRKHSPRMLMAERVMDDLLTALHASDVAETAELREALTTLEGWDRTADAGSRGGVLFQLWADRYADVADTARFFAEAWDVQRPVQTPRGIGSPDDAVAAFRWAVGFMDGRGWRYDVPWGDVYRVIRGDVDEPVAGCPSTMGCFRTLSYSADPSGRFAADRGDGWIFAVEFGNQPRAYSVLAYGESNLPDSPHFADQAAMFAQGRMKSVAFTRADIEAGAVRRYRPNASGVR